MLRSRRLSVPRPTGSEVVEHHGFSRVLEAVASGGVAALDSVQTDLDDYISFLQTIDPDTLDPPPDTGVYTMGIDCLESFSVDVTDPENDTLYYRWFVDYSRRALVLHETEPVQVRLGDVGRANINFTPNALDFFGEVPKNANPHLIELYVADRPFSETRGPRVLADPEGQIDSFVWTVMLVDCEGP